MVMMFIILLASHSVRIDSDVVHFHGSGSAQLGPDVSANN